MRGGIMEDDNVRYLDSKRPVDLPTGFFEKAYVSIKGTRMGQVTGVIAGRPSATSPAQFYYTVDTCVSGEHLAFPISEVDLVAESDSERGT